MSIRIPQESADFRILPNKISTLRKSTIAVTGKTAAELITERADSSRPNMA